MRPEGREALPDKAGESTLLSRSGGDEEILILIGAILEQDRQALEDSEKTKSELTEKRDALIKQIEAAEQIEKKEETLRDLSSKLEEEKAKGQLLKDVLQKAKDREPEAEKYSQQAAIEESHLPDYDHLASEKQSLSDTTGRHQKMAKEHTLFEGLCLVAKISCVNLGFRHTDRERSH